MFLYQSLSLIEQIDAWFFRLLYKVGQKQHYNKKLPKGEFFVGWEKIFEGEMEV
jgi:hypothetical protein